MQKKKVLLLTTGNIDHASSRIRAINHFKKLSGYFQTTWIPRVGIAAKPTLIDRVKFAILKFLYAIKQWLHIVFIKYDIVFIQVMFLPEWCLKLFKRRRTLICWDFDDAIYTYSIPKFELMLRYTDKVVVASPYLKNYVAKYKTNCKVIFSPVDTEVVKPAEKTDGFIVGWIGSEWTAHYLDNITQPLQRFAAKYSLKLIVIGSERKIEGVNTETIEWSTKNELSALNKMHVGIMPLNANDEVAEMKGGYKLYLYMAAGLPVIASPFGINKHIINHGVNGFLAETVEDWINTLQKLSTDENLRKTIGTNARLTAEENYSYNICTPQLLNFIQS